MVVVVVGGAGCEGPALGRTHCCAFPTRSALMHRGLPMLPCRCSKLDHCLYDLLIRVENGELACSIPIIISNHPGG